MRLRVGRKTAAHQPVFQQGGIHCCHDGIHLRCVARAEHGQHADQRVQHGQKLPAAAKAVFNIIHWPADPLAGLAALTKMHRQRNFRKLCAHTEQCGTPHPEDGAGAADGDSARHTGNVAGAHCARQCGAYCLKRRHGTVRSIFFAEHAPCRGAHGIRGICGSAKKPVRTLSSSPTPMMHTMAGMPQIKLFTA